MSPPAPSVGPPLDTPPLSSTSCSRRPLQREGARVFLSSAEQAMEDAMARSTPLPEPVLGKRIHRGDDPRDGGDTDTEGEPSPTVQPVLSSVSNVTAACQRYAARKKLRPEQRDDIDAFLLDSALGRQAKLFMLLMSVDNKIDTQQSAAPPYAVSEDLKTNINNYSIAVMLSVNISAYKGGIPRNHVLDILKRYRFDLPPGIEHDYANWEKITASVNYSLTQARSKVKKLVRESIKSNVNVFSLAQLIVHGTPCRPTVQLCARVALMRAIYIEFGGGEKYWNNIDARLEFIRSRAEGSPCKTARAFNEVLRLDRLKYGAGEDYEIREVIPDAWQQRVDDVVAGAADVAQPANATPGTPDAT